MSIFKNKHMIIAMFVAPVLAILAYFATDYVVSEKPHAAKPGATYRLAAKSNCRYQSGVCTLENGDIELHIRSERIEEHLINLTLVSDNAVQQILVSFSQNNNESTPEKMKADITEKNKWQVNLTLSDPEQSTMRMAVIIDGTTYYAETPTTFVDFSTSFSRENFSS